MIQLYKLIKVCFMNFSPSGKNQMMDICKMSSANNYSLCSISASDQKAVSRASCLSKDVKNAILKKIAEKIESEMSRASADGKTPHGIKLSVINKFKTEESQSWVNWNLVDYYLKTTKWGPTIDFVTITSEETGELSALTGENMTSMNLTKTSKAGDSADVPPGELLSELTTKGGRPKGSTNECKDDFQLCFLQVKNYATTEYNKLQVEIKPGKHVK